MIFTDGLSFSAVPGAGVRFAQLAYDPTRWDILEFQTFASLERKMIYRAYDIEGKAYDYLGALAFKLPFFRQINFAYFCTEAIAHVLQAAGYLKGYSAHKFSPNQLSRVAEKKIATAQWIHKGQS